MLEIFKSMMSGSTASYPWYDKKISKEKPLEQGDFILKCQIVEPNTEAYAENQALTANVAEYDVIVMSQSCDLIEEKIELALVCPFYMMGELEKLYSDYKSDRMKEKLRQGNIIGYHLLNKCEVNGKEDFIVVDFKSVYALPLILLKKIALGRGNRIRLLPPYREHLSQAFARFFMRVGLPVDIPAFK